MLEETSLVLPLEPENDLISEIEIEEDDPIEFQYSTTWYGADYTVDSLVKRIQRGDIYVPKFQRNYIWDIKEASRFIESLLLGLPVPGIFLAKEEDTKKLIVIDGNQRLKTLEYFYIGFFENGKEFKLVDVHPRFMKLKYDSLSSEDRRQLDDSILHATIVQQNETNNSDIYSIFERLNTGGVSLNAQEIRSSIYHGYFKYILEESNKNQSWRAIYNNSTPDKRLKDEELILRFMALFDLYQQYKKPMKSFLNYYMRTNNNEKNNNLGIKKDLFIQAIELIHRCIGNRAFKIKNRLNPALFDAVMVGLATKIADNSNIPEEKLKQAYDNLIQNQEFLSFIQAASTTENNAVRSRIDLAIKAFAEIV